MKKLFTFCFFAFAMLIGTQSALAQDTAKINESAYAKAKELRSQIKFDDVALEKVYMAYQANDTKLQSIEKHLQAGTADYNNAIIDVNKKLQSNIKTALGNDLFKRYLIVTDQEEIVD